MTGHSDYKAMKPYIDIADEVKSSYMKQFDEQYYYFFSIWNRNYYLCSAVSKHFNTITGQITA